MKRRNKQKAYIATDESEKQLEHIAEVIGDINQSAAIRYCIAQVYKQLQKEAS